MPTQHSIMHTTREQAQKTEEAAGTVEGEVDANYENTEHQIQTASSKGSLDN